MTALPPPLLSGRILLALGLTSAGSLHAAPKLDFNRDVRPVLAQHCFKCHGMDDHG
ncbi:MAG: hypothetical protein RLZZ253_3036, partial [Verrucomicrobiota bacterium]